jgi:hypothetical protein
MNLEAIKGGLLNVRKRMLGGGIDGRADKSIRPPKREWAE